MTDLRRLKDTPSFCFKNGFKKNSEEFPRFFSLSHVRIHTKFRPDQFSRFDAYWIQTDRQTVTTDKQSLYK